MLLCSRTELRPTGKRSTKTIKFVRSQRILQLLRVWLDFQDLKPGLLVLVGVYVFLSQSIFPQSALSPLVTSAHRFRLKSSKFYHLRVSFSSRRSPISQPIVGFRNSYIVSMSDCSASCKYKNISPLSLIEVWFVLFSTFLGLSYRLIIILHKCNQHSLSHF